MAARKTCLVNTKMVKVNPEPDENGQYHVCIEGVNVLFPFRPYHTQVAMMHQLLSAVKSQSNALLESPTGTGKSLSLLCSVLAWQQAVHATQPVKDPPDTPSRSDEEKTLTLGKTTKETAEQEKGFSSSSVSFSSRLEPEDGFQTQVKKDVEAVSAGLPSAAALTSTVLPQEKEKKNSRWKFDAYSSGVNEKEKTSSGARKGEVRKSKPRLKRLVRKRPPSGKTQIKRKAVSTGQVIPGTKKRIRRATQSAPQLSLPTSFKDQVPYPSSQLETDGSLLVVPTSSRLEKEASDVLESSCGLPVKEENGQDRRLSGDEKSSVIQRSSSDRKEKKIRACTGKAESQSFEMPMDTFPSSEKEEEEDFYPSRVPQKLSLPLKLEKRPKSEGVAAGLWGAAGEEGKKKRVRIYVCSRTHSQLQQLVQELRASAYRPKMCVLASRDQYCIHHQVAKADNVTSMCKATVAAKGCVHHRNLGALKMAASSAGALYDIEEMKVHGKRLRSCPFFAARALATQADIVFCPYNYILSSRIRKAMDIRLQDAVVIIDEAHNLEQVCCDAASWMASKAQLHKASREFSKIVKRHPHDAKSYAAVLQVLERLLDWVSEHEPSLQQVGFEKEEYMWQGERMVAALVAGGAPSNAAEALTFHEHVSQVAALQYESQHHRGYQPEETQAEENGYAYAARYDDEEEGGKVGSSWLEISGSSLVFVEALANTLLYLYGDCGRDRKHFRLVLRRQRGQVGEQDPASSPRRWERKKYSKQTKLTSFSSWKTELCLWCLSPAVVFGDVASTARSVILSSGTLSPLPSFSAELGTPFPQVLEAPHVIDVRRQLWAGALLCGPSGRPLDTRYRNAESLLLQDDVGSAVLAACQAIPHGVLCFVPSYAMLARLAQRWQATGLTQRLLRETGKRLICEPRGAGNDGFEECIRQYYEAVDRGGALFLAVCRGRASEGIDFSGARARGVLVVGIPYPNVRDQRVTLKRGHNDELTRKGDHALSGREWYEQCAFRALNQALGRCIRHRQDYGAVILLEARHKRGVPFVSRWLRNSVRVYRQFERAFSSLQRFFGGVGQAMAVQKVSPVLSSGTATFVSRSENLNPMSNRPLLSATRFSSTTGWEKKPIVKNPPSLPQGPRQKVDYHQMLSAQKERGALEKEMLPSMPSPQLVAPVTPAAPPHHVSTIRAGNTPWCVRPSTRRFATVFTKAPIPEIKVGKAVKSASFPLSLSVASAAQETAKPKKKESAEKKVETDSNSDMPLARDAKEKARVDEKSVTEDQVLIAQMQEKKLVASRPGCSSDGDVEKIEKEHKRKRVNSSGSKVYSVDDAKPGKDEEYVKQKSLRSVVKEKRYTCSLSPIPVPLPPFQVRCAHADCQTLLFASDKPFHPQVVSSQYWKQLCQKPFPIHPVILPASCLAQIACSRVQWKVRNTGCPPSSSAFGQEESECRKEVADSKTNDQKSDCVLEGKGEVDIPLPEREKGEGVKKSALGMIDSVYSVLDQSVFAVYICKACFRFAGLYCISSDRPNLLPFVGRFWLYSFHP